MFIDIGYSFEVKPSVNSLFFRDVDNIQLIYTFQKPEAPCDLIPRL